MMLLALIVGTLLIAAGAVSASTGAAGHSLVLMFFGFLICFGAWCEHKPHVLRMLKDGRTIIDHSKGAWTVTWMDGRWWLAHMGEEWVRRYGHTWAIGKGRDRVWWYEPKGVKHGEG